MLHRHRSPLKKGASREGKGERDKKGSRRTPAVSKSPREEKNVSVATTAGGHLDAHPAAPNKPSGTLKPQPRVPVLRRYPLLRWKKLHGAPLQGHTVNVSGPLSRACWHHFFHRPCGQSRSSRGSDATKPQCTCLG
jgi:hypothetical protein